MQKEVNQFICRLDGKIEDRELQIVKTQLMIFLKDYELTKKTTELMPVEEGTPKELREYLITKKLEGFTQATLHHYFYILDAFTRRVRKPVGEITTSEIQLYLYELETTHNMHDVTLQNVQIIIKAFFKWLHVNEYIEKNPAERIKTMKVEKKMRKPLTDIEMEKLRRACKNRRDLAIVEVLYSTGCRASELINLKLEDLNFDKREVHLFGKGKKHRTSYLSARAMIAVKDYLQTRGFESEDLFCNNRRPYGKLKVAAVQKIIREAGRAAGIQGNVFPHRIRHTTATDALDKGMEIEEVKSLLGHESIGTTLIYTEIRQENVKRHHQQCIV